MRRPWRDMQRHTTWKGHSKNMICWNSAHPWFVLRLSSLPWIILTFVSKRGITIAMRQDWQVTCHVCVAFDLIWNTNKYSFQHFTYNLFVRHVCYILSAKSSDGIYRVWCHDVVAMHGPRCREGRRTNRRLRIEEASACREEEVCKYQVSLSFEWPWVAKSFSREARRGSSQSEKGVFAIEKLGISPPEIILWSCQCLKRWQVIHTHRLEFRFIIHHLSLFTRRERGVCLTSIACWLKSTTTGFVEDNSNYSYYRLDIRYC